MHCGGVPLALKIDINGKNHCGSCPCFEKAGPGTFKAVDELCPAVVTCVKSPQCGWRGRFAEYFAHAENCLHLLCEAVETNEVSELSFNQSEYPGLITATPIGLVDAFLPPNLDIITTEVMEQKGQAEIEKLSKWLKDLCNSFTEGAERNLFVNLLDWHVTSAKKNGGFFSSEVDLFPLSKIDSISEPENKEFAEIGSKVLRQIHEILAKWGFKAQERTDNYSQVEPSDKASISTSTQVEPTNLQSTAIQTEEMSSQKPTSKQVLNLFKEKEYFSFEYSSIMLRNFMN